MGFATAAVSVGTTATKLTVTDADGNAGMGFAVQVPTGGATVYIGSSSVTTTTGWAITAGNSFSVDLRSAKPVYKDATEDIYAVVATGTQTVICAYEGV